MKVLLQVTLLLGVNSVAMAQKKNICTEYSVEIYPYEISEGIYKLETYHSLRTKVTICPPLLSPTYFKDAVFFDRVSLIKQSIGKEKKGWSYSTSPSKYFKHPASLRLYADSPRWEYYTEQRVNDPRSHDGDLYSDSTNTFPHDNLPDSLRQKSILELSYPYKQHLLKYYTDFYFKRTEVTNAEYREFYTWVVDSIITAYTGITSSTRTWQLVFTDYTSDKIYIKLNKAIDSASFAEKLKNVLNTDFRYASEGKTIYIDNKKISYLLYLTNSLKKKVDLLPNKSCFKENFYYSYNEIMADYYFSHPKYFNYPIVGITWWQAKAFCAWKTARINEQLKKEHPDFYVVVDLPSEIEWERVCLMGVRLGEDQMKELADDKWTTDLQLNQSIPYWTDPHYFTVNGRNRPLNLTEDGCFYPNPADLTKLKLKPGSADLMLSNLTSTGISGLGNNVSEWMLENYQNNWKLAFKARQSRLDTSHTTEARLIQQIEMYYNSQCDTNGYLVRGANWFDERYQIIYGRNKAGANAKTFVDPNKSFSTLGFRYVIHVYRKTEN
ncbi:MAG: formylglycine-generating enzyme family protein [Bacteroidia bacterium]|nr:formylglycine-generating enzyme family protein [Bacteroidia bacterium]